MRTGQTLHTSPPEPVKLAPTDEEKVSNIMEVCQVAREEAIRVLDACHMDETMAIERILSGNGLSSWSEVSKKKKPTVSQPHQRPSGRNHGGGDRERDRRGDRRDRERTNSNTNNNSNSQPDSSLQTTTHSNGGGRRPSGGGPRSNYHNSRGRDNSSSGPPHHGRKRFGNHHHSNSNHYHNNTKSAHPKSSSTQSQNNNNSTTSSQLQDAKHVSSDSLPSQPNSSMDRIEGEVVQSWDAPPHTNDRNKASMKPTPANKVNGAKLETWGEAPTAQNWGSEPKSMDAEQNWPSEQASVTSTSMASQSWSVKDSMGNGKDVSKAEGTVSSRKNDAETSSKKTSSIPSANTTNRAFNYAAIVASGTSHQKSAPVPVVPERVAPVPAERVTSSSVNVADRMNTNIPKNTIANVSASSASPHSSSQTATTAHITASSIVPSTADLVSSALNDQRQTSISELVSGSSVSERLSPVAQLDIESDAAVNENVNKLLGMETSGSSLQSREHRGRTGLSSRVADVVDSMNSSTPKAERSSRSVLPVNSEPIDVALKVENTSPGTLTTPTSLSSVRVENLPTATSTASAWSTMPNVKDTQKKELSQSHQLEDSSTALAVASAAVTGNEPSGDDALNLQFGSFGLSGLDINWSSPTSEKKTTEESINKKTSAPSISHADKVVPSTTTTSNTATASSITPAVPAIPSVSSAPVTVPVKVSAIVNSAPSKSKVAVSASSPSSVVTSSGTTSSAANTTSVSAAVATAPNPVPVTAVSSTPSVNVSSNMGSNPMVATVGALESRNTSTNVNNSSTGSNPVPNNLTGSGNAAAVATPVNSAVTSNTNGGSGAPSMGSSGNATSTTGALAVSSQDIRMGTNPNSIVTSTAVPTSSGTSNNNTQNNSNTSNMNNSGTTHNHNSINPNSMTSNTSHMNHLTSAATTVGLHLPNSSNNGNASGGGNGGNGGGMFPTMLMGHTGNFPPANYAAPYLVSPLHGYSPALNSYDNGNELASSRGPNLAPGGSLPLYDPTNISGMAASGNGKYGTIPGLGDMSGLGGMQSGGGKDGLQVNGGDINKNNGLGTSGLGTGMDALPYMINPGYASMQYPMYTFPTPPYGPPGMAAGHSPFPYPAAGQVSSQGGRGGFGFDEEDVGLGVGGNGSGGRNASGLGGESMYTPGGYLNHSMSHNGNPKSGADGSYKSVRGGNAGGGTNSGTSGASSGAGGSGTASSGASAGGSGTAGSGGGGTGLNGMGMGSGMVGGMGGYTDYSGSSVGNGVGSNNNNMGGAAGAPGGWGNRGAAAAAAAAAAAVAQANAPHMRMDGNVSAGMMSNGSMVGAGGGNAGHVHQASSGYVNGPGGGAGSSAYWTQQGHYYS